MNGPIRWLGGKGRMAAKIVPLLPPHRIYVEPFGGGAAVLFAKTPSPIEVYNDLDSGLVNLFRVLRDKDQFEELRRLASLTLYAREEYNDCRARLNADNDSIIRAYRFYVVARCSFSGVFGYSWGSAITKSCKGMAETCSSWLSAIDNLSAIYARLMRVQIEHEDFRTILKRYDTPDTLFYLDPPYCHDARRSGEYKHEMTNEDHVDMVRLLLKISGKAVLSGYATEVHQPLETAGWWRKDFQVSCSAAGRTRATGILGEGACLKNQTRTETLWIKPYRTGGLFGEAVWI